VALIERHDANSTWWGSDVAIVRQPEFFELGADARAALLAPYDWAEWRGALDSEPSPQAISAAGFWWADVQISFRLALRRVHPTPSSAELEVASAAERAFDPAARPTRPFGAERYLMLDDVTPERLATRYAAWAAQLTAADPEWAVEVRHAGVPQGWFCATPGQRGLRLTLAALYDDAVTAGPTLYRAAIRSFADRGARIGWASFSVRNAAVLNLYAELGAHFAPQEVVWLWTRGALDQPRRT
jgi:hypothetical protein